MKTKLALLVFVALIVMLACKKDKNTVTEPAPVVTVTPDNYSSLSDFYLKNGVAVEKFSFIAGSGGSFISAKGTSVNIAANTFTPASANISIEFRDIYDKSDMVLSDMQTMYSNGSPLKSAGEFFIKALNNDVPAQIASGQKIEIKQPLNGSPVDTAMKALSLLRDASASNVPFVWFQQQNIPQNPPPPQLSNIPFEYYIYSLYSFAIPASNGTWCNSDNSSFFASYPQTTLTVRPNQSGLNADVFLIFKNIKSMVHVYKDYIDLSYYKYYFAPIGLECTVVVLGIKDGKVFSSFTPITISSNKIVDFELTETTTEKFKADLKALD